MSTVHTSTRVFLGSALALSLLSTPAFAQAPAAPAAAPPPGWTGSFGAGLALTQGNSDTSTVNVAYEVKRDTGSNLLFRSTALFIRGSSEGVTTTNRLAAEARVDRKLSDRASVFGQTQFLQDEFKSIDYLVSPTLGLAYQLVKTDRTEFGIDAGAGVVMEKNPGLDVQTSGALVAGQSFKHKLSATSEITQRSSALWKMDDFEDALYILAAGIASNLTANTQIKAEVLNTLKNRPPSAAVKKNDVAVLVSAVYKF